MKKFLIIALAGFTAACVTEAPGVEMHAAAEAEADLATVLTGRVAGQPLGCVNQRMLQGPRSAGPGVLVFEGPGDTVYVNRTQGDCGNLKVHRSVRFTTTSSQLCRGDLAQTFDPYNGMLGGACNLGEFVPYRTAG